MSTPLITIKNTSSLIDALQIMNTHHFRRLPIINDEQKLVGILTDEGIVKVILSNKDLLSDYYNNKKFEPSYSILEEFRDRIFETILNLESDNPLFSNHIRKFFNFKL
jgi:predicted transcriptional regulator